MSKWLAVFVLSVVCVALVVVSSTPTQAGKIDNLKGARCSIPGVVKNRSSSVMLVRGDLPDDSRQRTYTLYPGQDSDRHTPLCDVDYYTVTNKKFWHLAILHKANKFTGYIGFASFKCVNLGNHVDCYKIWPE